MSELPQRWVECEMGDVAKVIGGGTPDSQDPENFSTESGIPWLTPADLSDNKAIHVARGKRFLTEKGFNNSSARIVPKGTVLFSSRAPIGYVAIAANEISTNQGFKSFVCPDGISSEYIYFWLRFATPLAEELASGTTFAEISGKNAAKIPLRLAPLAEQRRIVAKLEKLLGQVDACQQRLEKMPTLLKRFRQSVLAAACSGRLTADWREENPKAAPAVELLRSFGAKPTAVVGDDIPVSWCWGKFGELVTNHDGKRIPIKQSDRDKRSGPYPYYGAFGIIDDIDEYIYDGEYLLLAEDGKNLESRLRPISLIASGKFWVNNHAHVLQTKGGIPLSYLNAWLNSPSLDLSPFLTGIDQVKLNRAAMDKIPVPVAPLAEQLEIVRRVASLFALADQLEQRLAQARKQVDKLTPSLLARAFAGKLVSQDPTDEPAAKLLERIRKAGPRIARIKRGKDNP